IRANCAEAQHECLAPAPRPPRVRNGRRAADRSRAARHGSRAKRPGYFWSPLPLRLGRLVGSGSGVGLGGSGRVGSTIGSSFLGSSFLGSSFLGSSFLGSSFLGSSFGVGSTLTGSFGLVVVTGRLGAVVGLSSGSGSSGLTPR